MSLSSFLSSIPAALIALDNLTRRSVVLLEWAHKLSLI